MWREDILLHAYELAKANKGAPGVDGQGFEHIESEGREKWLEGIRKDLRDKTYEPRAVRRVMIPKPGGGERPLGMSRLNAMGSVHAEPHCVHQSGSGVLLSRSCSSFSMRRW